MRRRSPLRSLVLVTAASILGAACGGTPAAAPQPSGEPNQTLKITFQPATESLAVLAQLNAFAGGYFDREKLQVTYNPVISNAAQAAQSVTNGSADIAIAGSTGVVAGVAARRDMVTVAVITKGPTTQITLRNDVIQRLGISATAPLATRMKALKGLRLALPQPGSTTDVAVREALKANGLDPDKDLTIRPITDPTALVTAAREGQVDGFGFSPPTSVQPVAGGYGAVWVTLSDIPTLKKLPWIDVVTSKAYLKSNREAATRFVRALYKSAQDLKAKPEDARTRIKSKYFPDLNSQIYNLAFDLSLPTAIQGIDPDPSSLPTLMTVVNSNLDTKVTVSAAQLYDTTVLGDAKK